MISNRTERAVSSRKVKPIVGLLGLTLAIAFCNTIAQAQSDTAAAKQSVEVTQTIYLTNANQQNDGNEILIAVRNVMPSSVKLSSISTQNAILVRGTLEEVQVVEKLVSELNRPRKIYRLTYTIAELDSGKRIGIQHFAMVVASGQRTVLKQGSRVPISTGTIKADTTPQMQMQYLDVGMSFDVTLDESANGVRLRSKVEQSSVAEEKSTFGGQDPIIRQTMLEGTSFLTAGKPLMLGSLDMAGSTRHLDVEVVMERVLESR